MPDEYASPPRAMRMDRGKDGAIHARTGDLDNDRLAATHRHLLRLLTVYQAHLAQQRDQPRLQAPDRPLGSPSSSLTAPHQRSQDHNQLRDYQRFCTIYILALTQSSASLPEIVDFASALLRTPTSKILPHLRLPGGNARDPFRILRRRAILTLDRIAACLPQDLNLQRVSLIIRPNPCVDQLLISDGTDDGPKHWVPAKPWTIATDSDEAVSELVSTFLTWMNPFWRLVEEDLFLKAMRARTGTVDYCSPLLVNCMLALASQHSEIDEAFYIPGDLITRGEHFHQEALRLLALEKDDVSITGVQARLLLSFDSVLRGRDLSTMELTIKAADLNKRLPLPSIRPKGLSDYARARKCLDASVSFFALSLHLSWLMPLNDAVLKSMVSLDLKNLPDEAVYWCGYPAESPPKLFRPTLLLQERAYLTRLTYMATELLLSQEKRDPIDFRKALDALTFEAESWLMNLPNALQATPDMPAPLFQFHAQYHGIVLVVYTRGADIFARLSRRMLDPEVIGMVSYELRQLTLKHVLHVATLVRWCREVYGFSFANPSLFHAVTTALMAALPQLPSRAHATHNDRNLEIDSAFEECFRFLLACGMQQQFPRGLARMVYLSAQQMKIQLPNNVSRLVEVVLEAAWQRSLILNSDSLYPNIVATISQEESDERQQHTLRMGELLKLWDEVL